MMYPDATFTMRVSYGAVKSYRPRDAVFYDYVTTSKGLLEKYKAGVILSLQTFCRQDFTAAQANEQLMEFVVDGGRICRVRSGSQVAPRNCQRGFDQFGVRQRSIGQLGQQSCIR